MPSGNVDETDHETITQLCFTEYRLLWTSLVNKQNISKGGWKSRNFGLSQARKRRSNDSGRLVGSVSYQTDKLTVLQTFLSNAKAHSRVCSLYRNQ